MKPLEHALRWVRGKFMRLVTAIAGLYLVMAALAGGNLLATALSSLVLAVIGLCIIVKLFCSATDAVIRHDAAKRKAMIITKANVDAPAAPIKHPPRRPARQPGGSSLAEQWDNVFGLR